MRLTFDHLTAIRDAAQSVADRVTDELAVFEHLYPEDAHWLNTREMEVPFHSFDEFVVKKLMMLESMTQINVSDEIKARAEGNDS